LLRGDGDVFYFVGGDFPKIGAAIEVGIDIVGGQPLYLRYADQFTKKGIGLLTSAGFLF
jgi:hypothetical protein